MQSITSSINRWWNGETEFDHQYNGQNLTELYLKLAPHREEPAYRYTFARFNRYIQELDTQRLDAFLSSIVVHGHERLVLSEVTPEQIDDLLSYKQLQFNEFFLKKVADEFCELHERLSPYLRETEAGLVTQTQNLFLTFWRALIFTKSTPQISAPKPTREEAEEQLHGYYQSFNKPLQILNILATSFSGLTILWWAPYAYSLLALGAIVLIANLVDRHYYTPDKTLVEMFMQVTGGGAIVGREEEVKKIARSFGSFDAASMTPILVGPNGIGKMGVVRAYAREHDKKIFVIDSDFEQIVQFQGAVKGREKEYILCIRNIENFVDDVRLSAIGSQIIGLTTTDGEFANGAFTSFTKIAIEPMGTQSLAKAVLEHSERMYKSVLLTEDAATRIAALSGRSLANAKNLLKRCVNSFSQEEGIAEGVKEQKAALLRAVSHTESVANKLLKTSNAALRADLLVSFAYILPLRSRQITSLPGRRLDSSYVLDVYRETGAKKGLDVLEDDKLLEPSN